MDIDLEIRKKEAEVAALRDEAARIVAAASMQGRELSRNEDASVLALLSRVHSLEDEIHRLVKRRKADQHGAQ